MSTLGDAACRSVRATRGNPKLMRALPLRPAPKRHSGWGEPVQDFIKCLEQHEYDRCLRGTVYWVCAYALRQHDLGAELPSTAESHVASGAHSLDRSPFALALALAKGTVSIVDSKGTAFERAWVCAAICSALQLPTKTPCTAAPAILFE